MSQQQEEPEKDSIEYIRNNQCRAIYERATVCMQQQDTSEECRRAGDELFVCIGKIKFPSSYKNLENCRNKYNIQSNISLARADTLSPCYLATEALRNAYLSEVTRVKEDYSTERIPLKLRSDFRQDK